MKIAEHQISMVIKTYLRHSKDRFGGDLALVSPEDQPDDIVQVSEEGRRVLYERMEKRVAERARRGPFPLTTESIG
jgi:hypothetical protein